MRIRQWLLMLVMTAVMAGCNTIAGFGKDLQSAGKAITGTAEDTEEDIED